MNIPEGVPRRDTGNYCCMKYKISASRSVVVRAAQVVAALPADQLASMPEQPLPAGGSVDRVVLGLGGAGIELFRLVRLRLIAFHNGSLSWNGPGSNPNLESAIVPIRFPEFDSTGSFVYPRTRIQFVDLTSFKSAELRPRQAPISPDSPIAKGVSTKWTAQRAPFGTAA